MSKIGKNLVFLLVSQLATWSATSIMLVVVPNVVGPTALGQLGFAAAFVGYFALVASLGTNTLLVKTVSRDPAELGRFVFNALVLKVLMCGALSALALAVAALIGSSGDTMLLVAVGCMGMLFLVLNEVFVGAQAGLEVMGKPALWGVAQVYTASALGLIVLALGGGIVLYSLVLALALSIPLIANGRAVWPWLSESRRIDFGVWKVLVRRGIPLMVLSGLTLVYGTIDIPILHSIAGEETVGWYTLAYRFVGIPIFIATAGVTAFFPSFTAHGASLTAEFHQGVNRALRLVVLVSLPAAIGIAVVADDVVELFYDSRYYDAIPIMRILALHIPIVAVDVILGMALIASDREKRYVIVAAAAAVLSPIAALFMINWSVDAHDNGAIGAAITTVGVETFILCGALMLRSKGVMDRATAGTCLRIGLAGLVMAGAVWATDDLLLAVRIVVGIGVYGLASLAFRTVRVADLRRVVSIVTDAVGSVRRRSGADVSG